MEDKLLDLCLFQIWIVIPEETVDSNEDEEEVSSKPPGPLRSPEFFDSLRQAHPSQHTSPVEEESKENNHRLHSRNIFANKSPSKRPKFDLNATKPKGVKSRLVA